MTFSDRPPRRPRLLPAAQIHLSFAVDGETFVGDVIDISEHALRVSFARAPPLSEGRRIRGALLHDCAPDGIQIGELELKRRTLSALGGELALGPASEEVSRALGAAMRDLARGPHLAGGEEQPPPGLGARSRVPAAGRYTEPARRERLDWLRRQTGVRLGPLEATRLVPERLSGNVENMIGAVEVPVGVAGPLLFKGRSARGFICLPMATTEGALVSSVTRGAYAISRAGGVSTQVIRQQMTRVPLFVLSSLQGALTLAAWVSDHFSELRERVAQVSRHAKLVSVDPVVLGNALHLRFSYETGDAAGQNMTTRCTWHGCQWLLEQAKHLPGVRVDHFLIDSNMSGDKKVTLTSLISGRGVRAVTECHVPRAVLRRVLGVTPEQISHLHGNAVAGAIQSGMVGYNINVANVIAAVFTATGQDIACVHESSLGVLQLQSVDGGLYASLVLPSLVIGTVGGGTHLPAQNALLELLGCAGQGKVGRLAEIIAGYCLALDLSTAAAVASGRFADAHERLGRNRPVRWFAREDLVDPGLYESGLREAEQDPSLQVLDVEEAVVPAGSSILGALSNSLPAKKLVGLFGAKVRYAGATGAGEKALVVKVKPLDTEVLHALGMIAALSGRAVEEAWRRHQLRSEFHGCHLRELGIYEQQEARFRRHLPRVFAVHRDDARELYALVLERLERVDLLDSADHLSGWNAEALEHALEGAAALHSVWFGRETELRSQRWLGKVRRAEDMAEMRDLLHALALAGAAELPELVPTAQLGRQQELIDSVGSWWHELEQLPGTLIHNDFNPRNICLRRTAQGPSLCAYDWELATLQVPQHDLAELLAFVLPPDVERHEVDRWLEAHRRALERHAGRPIDAAAWRRGYLLSLQDLAVWRFAFYVLGHAFQPYGFLARSLRTLWRLIELEEG